MRINTNVNALAANRNLNEAAGAAGKSIERLSSGLRINRAADDAAGLVIAEKLKSQSNGINVAVRNAQDGIGLVQTADGALTETTNILHRMRDLAMHSGNGATTDAARTANQAEFDALGAELTRISDTTSFAGQKLLDGTLNTTLNVSADATSTIAVTVGTDFDATGLAVNGLTFTDAAVSQGHVATIDAAIDTVTAARGDLGAIQNRLEHTVANLSVTGENLQAAESRIRDTDMAAEMTKFSKENILQQASQAMLAQANSASQGVLQLLRG